MLSLYPFTLYSWLLLIASGVSLWLAYLGARQRQLPVAYWFSWLCLTEAVYTFGYAFELASRSLEQAKFWFNIEMVGGSHLPPSSPSAHGDYGGVVDSRLADSGGNLGE